MKKEIYQKGMLLIGLFFLLDAILSTINHPVRYSYIYKYLSAVIFLLVSADLLKKKIHWIVAVTAIILIYILELLLKYYFKA